MPRGAKPFFTAEQDKDVAARYQAGETLRQIGAAYGVTWRPVQASLERQGINRRSKSDYAWQETPENIAELVRLWNEGLSVQQIAKRAGLKTERISPLLRAAGISPRFGGQNHRFKGEQVEILAREYEAGASLNKLVEKYGGNAVTMRNTLRRAGVELRGTGNVFWTPERVEWLKGEYLKGRSETAIAKDLGLTQPAISRRLRNLGLLSERSHAAGPNHGAWKGGRTVRDGYVRVKIPDDDPLVCMRDASGYVSEHRLVMARKLGRLLLPGENPHHKNTIRTDNSPENLELWLTSQPSGGRVADLLEHALGLLDTYMPEALAPGWQDIPVPEAVT